MAFPPLWLENSQSSGFLPIKYSSNSVLKERIDIMTTLDMIKTKYMLYEASAESKSRNETIAVINLFVDDMDEAGLVDEYVVISNHKYAHHFENWAKEKKQKIIGIINSYDSSYTSCCRCCRKYNHIEFQ